MRLPRPDKSGLAMTHPLCHCEALFPLSLRGTRQCRSNLGGAGENEDCRASLAMTHPLCHCEALFPLVVARHDSAEAISMGQGDCRASLAMTHPLCHCEEHSDEAISVGGTGIATHLSGARNDKK
jgi:hypothetical protein